MLIEIVALHSCVAGGKCNEMKRPRTEVPGLKFVLISYTED